jgi:hypothetical protein
MTERQDIEQVYGLHPSNRQHDLPPKRTTSSGNKGYRQSLQIPQSKGDMLGQTLNQYGSGSKVPPLQLGNMNQANHIRRNTQNIDPSSLQSQLLKVKAGGIDQQQQQ